MMPFATLQIPDEGDNEAVEEHDQEEGDASGVDSAEERVVLAPGESISTYPYADATLETMKEQLRAAGKIPVEFIPLLQLKADVASLMRAAMAGEPHDEARLDYLSYCLDVSKII
jgi:hypothetical protein